MKNQIMKKISKHWYLSFCNTTIYFKGIDDEYYPFFLRGDGYFENIIKNYDITRE